MRMVLADGRIAEVTPEKTKVSESCSSGKNFPSRFSLHDQARCSTRRTITSSLHWEELDPAMELSHNSGISDAASAYIWNQDSTKKKDFTEWTCLRYIVYKAPETEPAILLAWADTSDDLAALKAAGQVLKALAGQGPWLRVPWSRPEKITVLCLRHLQITALSSAWLTIFLPISGKTSSPPRSTGHQ